jgi:hypothetical protein
MLNHTSEHKQPLPLVMSDHITLYSQLRPPQPSIVWFTTLHLSLQETFAIGLYSTISIINVQYTRTLHLPFSSHTNYAIPLVKIEKNVYLCGEFDIVISDPNLFYCI